MIALNLRAKILFPAAGMILVVVLVSLAIINNVVRRQVYDSVSLDLQRARHVFDELQQKQLELVIERSLVVADAPYLKAAVETGDPGTVQSVAEEVFRTVSSDLLVITDRFGRILSHVGHSFELDSLRNAGIFSQTEVGLLPIDSTLYRTVVVPIVSGNPATGAYVLGTAIFGSRIDLSYLSHFRSLTNSEIAFLLGDRIFATTLKKLKPHQKWVWGAADSSAQVKSVTIGGEEYIISLPALNQQSGGSYALLRSLPDVLNPILSPIEIAVGLVAVIAIVAAFGLSFLMARSVIQPVENLVHATDAVSGGDYDHPIAVETRDEIGHLAHKFDEMRQNLKRQMAQLAQRNVELESAMQQLKLAQSELVNSEKLAATGKITAQLSHELNNPIHNIRSCLESVQKKVPVGSPGREFLDLAHEEVLRISKLLRQMLDFYRPQAAESEPIYLQQVMQEIIKSSEDVLRQHRICCKCDLQDSLPAVVGSRDQLKQVFLNLVLNAVDALPQGGKIIVTGGANNGWVSLSVADDGVGIRPENLDRIFDAFFTTKSKASGVGLGLSVSYGIVRGHGGRIEVESSPGNGAKFTVKLPIEKLNR